MRSPEPLRIKREQEAPPGTEAHSIAPPKPLRVTTDWLMGGQREIVLEHRFQEYRLRITAAGKLILTK